MSSTNLARDYVLSRRTGEQVRVSTAVFDPPVSYGSMCHVGYEAETAIFGADGRLLVIAWRGPRMSALRMHAAVCSRAGLRLATGPWDDPRVVWRCDSHRDRIWEACDCGAPGVPYRDDEEVTAP